MYGVLKGYHSPDGEPTVVDALFSESEANCVQDMPGERREKKVGESSALPEKVFDSQADIACNLVKEYGGDISPRMEGNGGTAPVWVTELLVTALLTRFDKTEASENGHDFGWL